MQLSSSNACDELATSDALIRMAMCVICDAWLHLECRRPGHYKQL